MPKKLKPNSKGVRVHARLLDFESKPLANVAITISLPEVCVWGDRILPTRQRVSTDGDGEFELWLPPSSEIRTVSGNEVPAYFISCAGVGSWHFRVPDEVTELVPL
jgi:hypothetical protein